MKPSTFLVRLAEIGTHPDDPPEQRLRAGALISASITVMLLSFVWIGTYLAYGYPVSAAIPATYQVITVIGLIVLSRTKRFETFRTVQLALFLLLPALLQASLGGFVASSGMVLWSVMTPLAAVALLGVRRSLPWLALFAMVLLVLAIVDPRLADDPATLPEGVVVTFIVLNIAGMTLGAFLLLGVFVHQSERARAELAAEQARSERLLLNVLPAPIARRLKDDEGVIAERHDAVTVLFADLVDFTERSSRMAPEDLVRLLDRVFSAFDDLADAEGLEKIKTIGDAYMLAGGVPEARPDHAEAVVRTALAMQRAIGELASQDADELRVRIGIDTGPAVAGVIGRRKFIYDLWGDTVNTASRMESLGIPGEIQVTEHTADALRDRFELSPRGMIDVKGRGSMQTYLVVRERG